MQLYQFDINHDIGQRDEYWRGCFLQLYQFDINHDTRQCDEYWRESFFWYAVVS